MVRATETAIRSLVKDGVVPGDNQEARVLATPEPRERAFLLSLLLTGHFLMVLGGRLHDIASYPLTTNLAVNTIMHGRSSPGHLSMLGFAELAKKLCENRRSSSADNYMLPASPLQQEDERSRSELSTDGQQDGSGGYSILRIVLTDTQSVVCGRNTRTRSPLPDTYRPPPAPGLKDRRASSSRAG